MAFFESSRYHKTDTRHCNSLCRAIFQGTVDSVRAALIGNTSNINAKNPCGYVPLHFAIKRGCRAEVIKLLIDAGANLNLKSGQNANTPLHLALKMHREEIVKLLCENGASMSTLNSEGLTPFQLAASGYSHTVSSIKMFLDAGADINCKTKTGSTILHLAAHNSTEVFKYLLSRGLDVNAKDDLGLTPLHYVGKDDCPPRSERTEKMNHYGCLMQEYSPMKRIETMLMSGADANATNNQGETPLHTLVRSSESERQKVIELLLNHMKKLFVKEEVVDSKKVEDQKPTQEVAVV